MVKGNRRSKLGWFGWTIISVIFVAILGSTFLFFSILNLDIKSFLGGDQTTEKSNEPASDEAIERVEEVQETVGKDHQEVGNFVSKMHNFYNETTGYGAINSLEWNEQKEQASKVLVKLDEQLPKVNDEALKSDLERIMNLAEKAKNEPETDHIRNLHRMFHDLDIALNNYNGYDTIWNVTETLKTAD